MALYEKCCKIVEIIIVKCLPLCENDPESKIYFLKMIADHYRYAAENPPPKKQNEVKKLAQDYYNQAFDFC